MNYNETLNYINSLINREKRNLKIVKLDLIKVKKVIQDLKLKKKYIIKIIGTNGKGSVTAILSSIFKKNNISTVSFTSPHILSIRERIKFNDENISRKDFKDIFNILYKKLKYELSYFEIIFLMTLIYAEYKNCKLIILEAGLGGKFDVTNLIFSDIVVFTNISMDHNNILGNTIYQIALDKYYGISPNCKIISKKQEDLFKLLKIRAKILNSEIIFIDNNKIDLGKCKITDNGLYIYYNKWGILKTNLNGIYQIDNILLSFAVIELLKNKFNLKKDLIIKALSSIKIHGRFEILQKSPYLIIDGSHNSDGIKKTVESLKFFFGEKKFKIYLSLFIDKDYINFIKYISEIANKVIIVNLELERKTNVDKIKQELNFYNIESNIISISKAKKLFYNEIESCFLTGSFYLVSEILKVDKKILL